MAKMHALASRTDLVRPKNRRVLAISKARESSWLTSRAKVHRTCQVILLVLSAIYTRRDESYQVLPVEANVIQEDDFGIAIPVRYANAVVRTLYWLQRMITRLGEKGYAFGGCAVWPR